MSLIPLLLFISSLIFLLFGIFILLKAQNKLVSKIFNLFVFSFSFWSFGLAMFFYENDLVRCLNWGNFLYLTASFIPPSFVLFSYVFPNIKNLKFEFKYIFIFLPNLFFLFLFLNSSLMIQDVVFKNGVKTFIYGNYKFLWDLQFNGLLVFGFFRYIRMYLNSYGVLRNHLKYLLIGDLYIYIFAGTTNVLLPMFNIFDFIWLGPILSLLWVFIISYTIVKYKLLDLRVAITRAGIFICVYTLVLGIPIWIGFKLLGLGQWLIPISLMAFLATLGPFIYLFIQKKAEDRILIEQRRYQSTLRQASSGMGKIKDLKKLLNMIVYVLTRSVRIEHACIYIKDNQTNEYVIGAQKKRLTYETDIVRSFPQDDYLVKHLEALKSPIIVEEIKQHIHDHSNHDYENMEQLLNDLNAALIFPIFIDNDLVAIVVMGKKETGKLYTEDDLSVFTILANQAALAIENAQFYEDMKKTQQQLFQAEKMATIGTMADGLSHQINNRFHALGFIAGDALDTIKMSKEQSDSMKLKEMICDIESALKRVQDNVVQGGEIVQGLLRYTRKGDASFTAINIDAVLKAAVEMTQFKIKTHELNIIKDYDPANIPKVQANFTQLQEVFFNMIDNAYDAMMQRKHEAKEEGFKPTLHIAIALSSMNKVEIIFEDNGIGVKEADMQKLFTPFFTTKLSSKKGTGLGLYVIKKIIEDNHGGGVDFSSKYLVGTRMKLTLPLATS